MARPIEQPVETFVPGPTGGTKVTHPAFAGIQASRVTGQTHLYGSDFSHNHYVRIRISKSQLRRSLSSDWAMDDSLPYIEVDMSESQWAQFVSSMNAQATQCTLRSKDGNAVPELPAPQKRTDQFASEAKRTMESSEASIREAIAEVDAMNLSGKAKAQIKSKLYTALQNIGANIQFVADQFGEHMETSVERAKTEVNAYVNNAIGRAGIAALSGGAPIVALELNYQGDH